MLQQQPLIKSYVNKLNQQIHRNCQDGLAKLDVCAWFNYTTFDIISDLSFGEPFGCLKTGRMYPWIEMIFASVKTDTVLMTLRQFPLLRPFLFLFFSRQLLEEAAAHRELTKEKVSKRLAQQARPDSFQSITSTESGLVSVFPLEFC